MAQNSSTIRMGPISLFALVILICVAVMAVLTLSTSQATYSAAEKQMRFTSDTYSNEIAAQDTVKLIDETLYPLRQNGESVSTAMATLERILPSSATIENDTISMRFTEESGRSLHIAILIRDDLRYSITNWQAMTQWNEEPSTGNDLLWTGSS